MWRAINELTGKSAKLENTPINDITCGELNTHFTTIKERTIKNDKSHLNDLEPLIEYCKTKSIQSSCFIPLIGVHEVYQAVLQLKSTRTCGIDLIDSKILKLSAHLISETLTYIYNLCISKSTFPKIFKQAKVIPIHKANNRKDPNNYRPISILSNLSKPLEHHIHTHTMKHLEKYKLIHQNQSGFRTNHSCQTALISMVDHWLSQINLNRYCAALFVDFSKAFDIIDRNLLLKKLDLYGIQNNTLNLFRSFLFDRQQTVKCNNSFSSMLHTDYGVPQGSILGPLLFSLYINDLPLYISSNCDLFADDTTLHSSHGNLESLSVQMQSNVDQLIEWTELNHMALNSDKTKFMLITTRQKRQNIKKQFEPLVIDNHTIKEVDSHKLLGLIIDNNLSWAAHTTYIRNQIAKKTYALSRIKNVLNAHCRKLFFFAHIQSTLDYASSVWDNCSDQNMKQIRSIHRRSLKVITAKKKILPEDYRSNKILPLAKRHKI